MEHAPHVGGTFFHIPTVLSTSPGIICFHLLGEAKIDPDTALTNTEKETPYTKKATHLEGEIHGTVPNLIHIWQWPTIVLATTLSQLQILGFLQL